MALKPDKPRALDRDGAEAIAISALGFLAEDARRLSRFLALTGIGPDRIRAEALTPGLQAEVLEHLLGDESLLLMFAANSGIAPASIAPAHRLLAALSNPGAGS